MSDTGAALRKMPFCDDAEATLAYILDMIDQLAEMSAQIGAKDLASDLLTLNAEARRISGASKQ